MNIKKLNEELDKVLKQPINEISDGLKQQVIDKRREQVAKAQQKLNNAVKLSNIKKEIEITLNNPSVEVYEDSYTEGELGYVNYFTGDDVTGTISSVEDLLELIFDSVNYYDDSDYPLEKWGGSFNINDNDDIQTDLFLNDENEQPSESEKEEWKNGEIKLYNGHYYATVDFEEPEDREIFINIIKGSWDIN